MFKRIGTVCSMFVLLIISLIFAESPPDVLDTLSAEDSLTVLEAVADMAGMHLDGALEQLDKVRLRVPQTAIQRAIQIQDLRAARVEVAKWRAQFAEAKAKYCDLLASTIINDTEATRARRSAWLHRQEAARYKREAYSLATPAVPR